MIAVRRQRKSIRLKEYDYSTPGGYFVTICTQNHENMFGEINDETIQLSPMGMIAERCWKDIPNHYANVQLDEYVIMPDHVHGILILHETIVGVENFQPLPRNTFQHVIPNSIPSIVRSYKAAVTRECRKNNYHDFYWQRNYYEHIIRGDKDLNNVRAYIANNIIAWATDTEHRHEGEGF